MAQTNSSKTPSPIDMDLVINELPKDRIFTSEADFQFSLAWAIQEHYREYEVRLEEVFDWADNMHFDIVVHTKDGGIIPIELKYCTKSLPDSYPSKVKLKNQGAEDVRRYDFIKDVQRIEKAKTCLEQDHDSHFICGYAIMLTNSSLFWKSRSSRKNQCDSAFRLHEDKGEFGGEMMWVDASEGTMKGREKPLVTNHYKIVWKDYPHCSLFRYLSVMIE